MAAVMQHVMSHAQFLFPDIQAPTDPRLMALMGNNVQGAPAPQPEQPTPGPVANPMPAGKGPIVVGPGTAPAPRPPVLPRSTPPVVSSAAGQLNPVATPHLPQGKR